MDEKSLAIKCASRDEAAWTQFVSTYSDGIYTSIRRTLERHNSRFEQHTLDDIFGDVMVSLLADDGRKLLGFEGRNGSSLSTYLWVIASRTAVNHLRKNSRVPVLSPDPDNDITELAVDGRELADETIQRRQMEDAVASALAEMGPRDRLFASLYYDKGLPPEKIAGLLGVTVSTVYSQKNRFREKIRIIFGKKYGELASK